MKIDLPPVRRFDEAVIFPGEEGTLQIATVEVAVGGGIGRPIPTVRCERPCERAARQLIRRKAARNQRCYHLLC